MNRTRLILVAFVALPVMPGSSSLIVEITDFGRVSIGADNGPGWICCASDERPMFRFRRGGGRGSRGEGEEDIVDSGPSALMMFGVAADGGGPPTGDADESSDGAMAVEMPAPLMNEVTSHACPRSARGLLGRPIELCEGRLGFCGVKSVSTVSRGRI